MIKLVRFIAVITIWFAFAAQAWAADDKVIASLSGSNIRPLVQNGSGLPAFSIAAEDQQYTYMKSVGSDWACKFGVKRNAARVVLRYDQSKRLYRQNFTLKVTYNVKLYGLSGTPYTTLSAQTATISYQNAVATHTDIVSRSYEGAYRAEVIITAVDFNGAATIPASFDNDIYMDVIQETERYYNMGYVQVPCSTAAAPAAVVKSPFATNTTISQSDLTPYKNQLPVTWNFVQGAESYDLEWLFIDIGTGTSTGSYSDLFTDTYEVDFSRATRINTSENHYEIPMAYPKGILLYRVRPVGISYLAPYTARVEGPWNVSQSGGTTTANLSAAAGNCYRVNFNGLDDKYNWQYSAAYAEDGKRKEVISYFDGSLRNRQSVTLLNSDNNAVIAETKYDFQGRPAVQMLPTPFASKGIQYYSNFNPEFTKEKFDIDANYPATGPSPATAGMTNQAAVYYGADANAQGIDAYVPDAQGVPFTQTRYKTDGTGRVIAQSGVGPNHVLGSGHDTRYFYGTPGGQEELDRLFGNEVGNVSHYKKNLVVDPNGQVSVTYLDQEGRTIATALAGNVPASLLQVDKTQGSAEVITVDMLTGKNGLVDNARVSKTTVLTSQANTTYTFAYSLNWDEACQPAPCTLCKTCVFDLDIRISDQDGNSLSGVVVNGSSQYNGASVPTCTLASGISAVKCEHVSNATYTITVQFPNIGSYQVEKILKVNQGQLDQYRLDYLSAVQSAPCGPLTVPTTTVPCNDCNYICNKQYGVYPPTFITPTVNPGPAVATTDALGHLIAAMPIGEQAAAQAQAQSDYQACLNTCSNISVNVPDECTLKKQILMADMSPGGQYFDNIQDITNTCSPLPACNPSNPSYNESSCLNGWLTTNVSSVSGFWTGFYAFATTATNCPVPVTVIPDTFSNWGWIRRNWKTCFAEYLMQFHPEYCNYKYYCTGLKFCGIDDRDAPTIAITYTASGSALSYGPSPVVTMAHSRLYDKVFRNDQAASFINPLNMSNGGAPSQYVSNLASTPAPVSGSASPSRFFDPVFYGECMSYQVKCPNGSGKNAKSLFMDYLSKYYTANPSGTPIYMSLWYVLDDPDHISTIPANNTIQSGSTVLASGTVLDQATVDFFKALHGTNGPVTLGGKYEFFKNAYLGYKQFLLYGLFSTAYSCSTNSLSTSYTASSVLPADPAAPELTPCTNTGSSTLQHAQIRFPKNPMFEIMLTACPDFTLNASMVSAIGQATASASAGMCQSTCEGNAENWINEIKTKMETLCTGVFTNSLTTLAAIKADLIQVCLSGCDGNNPQGLDHTPSPSTTTITAPASGSTFSAVINYYLGQSPYSGCANLVNSISITHPATYSQGRCECENLKTFAINNNIAWNLSDQSTLSSQLASAINTELEPATAVTASDVCAWLGNCFARPSGVTGSCLQPGTPAQNPSAMTNLPQVLQCPTSDTPAPQQDCDAAQQQADVDYANAQAEYQAVMQGLQVFTNNYLSSCLTKALSNERLTSTYQLNEYYYTLYYYDQAGNLIKTVPPEGVRPLKVGSFTPAGTCSGVNTNDVKAYRLDPVTKPFIWPQHTLVTNYKYNSLNGVTDQQTPDAGISSFWYDAVGRLVVSQNAKQKAFTPESGYSYTKYDALARITEVGEILNATPMTDALSTLGINLDTWLADPDKRQITRTYYDEAPTEMVGSPAASALIASKNARSIYTGGLASNLRNRVACVTYAELDFNHSTPHDPQNPQKYYDYATHYVYDIHGNVQTLYNEHVPLASLGYDINRVDYEYDLVSGKVNQVHYNSGKADQFHHRYSYDADNRVTAAYTSRNGLVWEKEAKYFYYKHGPLARTETGDKQVQASDMAYTIHGWIKGVNSNSLKGANDIGNDGLPGTSNLNAAFAPDMYGYSLGYFNGDYQAKKGSASFLAGQAGTNNAILYPTAPVAADLSAALYNGNIANMSTSIYNNSMQVTPQLRAFRYDQLNRIKSAFAHGSFDAANNQWTAISTGSNLYRESFSYDLNGNIKGLKRYNAGSVLMDDLRYVYDTTLNCSGSGFGVLNHNKLKYVDDASLTNAGGEFTDQAAGNYAYDNIGNLIKDDKENISNITWTVYGKIKTIERVAGSGHSMPDLEFVYDATGNRIAKIVKPHASLATPTTYTTTHYVRDAQGNVMAVYEQKQVAGVWQLSLQEQHVYGSSRLGLVGVNNRVDQSADMVLNERFNYSSTALPSGWYDVNSTSTVDLTSYRLSSQSSTQYGGPNLGLSGLSNGKTYEVLYMLDKSLNPTNRVTAQIIDGSGGSAVITAMQQGAQGYNSLRFTARANGTTLKFENSEANGTLNRFAIDNIVVKEILDKRTLGEKRYELSNHLGNVLAVVSDRKLSVAPATVYADNHFTSNLENWLNCGNSTVTWVSTVGGGGRAQVQTTAAGNNCIYKGFTLVQGTTYHVSLAYDPGTNASPVSVSIPGMTPLNYILAPGVNDFEFQATASGTGYMLIAPVNPVVMTYYVDDIFVSSADSYFTAELQSANDYFAFGSTMSGRSFTSSSGKYRYGFNGKENDGNESVSTGEGLQDYGFRIYNPALGKFLSVDPLFRDYPWYTPYQFAGNKPIWAIDLDGAEENYEPLQKYKYGKEIDIKVAAVNRVKALGNVGTDLGNSFGYLFYLIELNATELLKSPEGWWKQVSKEWTQRWNNTGAELDHMKQNAKEMFDDPVQKIEQVYGGPEGFEGMVNTGLQLYMVKVTTPNYTPEMAPASNLYYKTMEELAEEVKAKSAQYTKDGQSPGTVIGAQLPNGETAVAPSSKKIPEKIAPSLLEWANQRGGLGAPYGGGVIGTCSEFHAANELLLKYPKFKPQDVKFTMAVRPRNMTIIPRCTNCTSLFGPEAVQLDTNFLPLKH